VVRQHVDVTFQMDPSAAVATIQATNYRPISTIIKIDAPSLQQISRYTDIDSSTTTSFTSHGNVPTLQLRTEKDVDCHHLGSATTTATASMDYFRTKKSMLPHQRYNHHFQFFVVWILLPILIVVVVVAATAMRMMVVVVRATPFPTVMLDLVNVETTTSTFSPTGATTTTLSTLTLTSTEAVVFTLRDILTDSTTGFHLAMAPSFFGFFGYFGMLAAWLDDPQQHPYDDQPPSFSSVLDQLPIRSVVGASAGAMVAILLAANIARIHAMTFVSNITLDQYSDFPGWGALFRGDLFETLMYQFLMTQQQHQSPLRGGTQYDSSIGTMVVQKSGR
jgi:hypothetical protein